MCNVVRSETNNMSQSITTFVYHVKGLHILELVCPEARLVAELQKKYDRHIRPVLDVTNVTQVMFTVNLASIESLVSTKLRDFRNTPIVYSL